MITLAPAEENYLGDFICVFHQLFMCKKLEVANYGCMVALVSMLLIKIFNVETSTVCMKISSTTGLNVKFTFILCLSSNSVNKGLNAFFNVALIIFTQQIIFK